MRKEVLLCDRCGKDIPPLHLNSIWVEARFSFDHTSITHWWECCLDCKAKHERTYQMDVKKYLTIAV